MVQEDVPAPDSAEDVLPLRQRRRDAGDEGRVLEVGAVQGQQRRQVGQPQGRLPHLLVRPLGPHLPDQQGAQRVRHVAGALVAHDKSEEALPQALLHGAEQVLPLPLPDLLVGVPGDAEEVAPRHGHLGEELVEVGPDDQLQPHQMDRPVGPLPRLHLPGPLGGRDGHEAGQVVRHLDPRVAGPQVRIVEGHGEVDAAVRDVRELVRGVDRQRGQHRVDLVLEVGPRGLALAGVELVHRQEQDPVGLQLLLQRLPQGVLLFPDRLQALVDHLQLLRGRPPIRQQPGRAGLDALPQLAQAGDVQLEELIDPLVGDAQHPGPVQQGVAPVARLFQAAPDELQPAQLGAEVPRPGRRLLGRGLMSRPRARSRARPGGDGRGRGLPHRARHRRQLRVSHDRLPSSSSCASSVTRSRDP